jgi:hypothetical protein
LSSIGSMDVSAIPSSTFSSSSSSMPINVRETSGIIIRAVAEQKESAESWRYYHTPFIIVYCVIYMCASYVAR